MTAFERWSVWLTSAVVAGTGSLYAWMKYLLVPIDAFAVVNHPLQPLVLKLHIVSAPLLVFVIGMITLRHVWPHYRALVPRGRRSGMVVALMTAPMILTGYLVQVITNVGWLLAIAVAHLVLGIMYAVGLVLHQVAVRMAASSRQPSVAEPDEVPSSSPPPLLSR